MTDEEILALVRYLIGDLPTELVSDATLLFILNRNRLSTDCETVYATLLETLLYLDRTNTVVSSGTGSITSRRERRGRTEIEVKYEESSSSSTNSWRSLYDDYVAHPEWVCSELAKTELDGSYYYIGGVSKTDRDAINDNTNIIGTGTKIGFLDDLV